MKPKITQSLFPKITSLTTSSSLALTLAASLASPLTAIERPTPAEQPAEKTEIAPQAKKQPKAKHSDKLTYLGVYGVPVSETLSAHLNIQKGKGIELELVAPNSPASKAELKKHDVILKIAERNITSMEDIREAVTTKKPGDNVEIEYITGGKKVVKTVTLSERTMPAAVAEVQPLLDEGRADFNETQEMLNKAIPKELLENFPEKDRERIMQLFKGQVVPEDLKSLEKKFGELNELNPHLSDLMPKIREGVRSGYQSRVKVIDNSGTTILESTEEGKIIELMDKNGKLQYSGPYNSEEDKLNIPEELRDRVKNLDIGKNMNLFKNMEKHESRNKSLPEAGLKFETDPALEGNTARDKDSLQKK